MKWWIAILIFIGLLVVGGIITSYDQSTGTFFMVAAFLFFAYSLFAVPIYYYHQTNHYKKKFLIKCPHCGYEGQGKKIVKGSIGVEIILWLFMLLPGMIYTAWRLMTSYFGCPKCSYNLVIRQ